MMIKMMLWSAAATAQYVYKQYQQPSHHQLVIISSSSPLRLSRVKKTTLTCTQLKQHEHEPVNLQLTC